MIVKMLAMAVLALRLREPLGRECEPFCSPNLFAFYPSASAAAVCPSVGRPANLPHFHISLPIPDPSFPRAAAAAYIHMQVKSVLARAICIMLHFHARFPLRNESATFPRFLDCHLERETMCSSRALLMNFFWDIT